MKKLLFLALSFGLLISCSKDDNNGIPPVNPSDKSKDGNTEEKPVATLEASTATVKDYQNGKAVKIHGNIVIEGNKSYFKLSDNTLILIYAPKKVFDTLTEETKNKLKIAGQELTVVGTFTDYQNTKEIAYQKESDLTFGATPPAPAVVELEAARATVSDFQDGKAVKIHGNITVQGNKAYFKFSDDTLIQIFAHKNILKTLSKEQKDNLKVNGKEVTVKGKFGTYQGTKQITYESASDLTFN